MAKRITPPDEIERVRERIFTSHRRKIADRATFDMAFAKTMMMSDLTDKQRKFRDDVFNSYKKEYGIATQRELTELRKDRKEFERDILRASKGEFSIPAREKGRIVYARKDSVRIRGKPVVRYRDKKGRFVSIKRKG